MEVTTATFREIAVPASIFSTLRDELSKEVGSLATIHALHHAGYEAGATAARAFGSPDGVDTMSQSKFWGSLSDFFSRRGWGSLTLGSEHTGVGILASADWAEAVPGTDDADASCSFSTGFMSGLLSALAGAPIAVLEVECRTRGNGQCRFAFGSEQAIHDLYGKLADGAELDGALAAL